MDEKRREPWRDQGPEKKRPSGCLIAAVAAIVVLLAIIVVLLGLNFAAPTRGFGSRADVDTPVEQWAERVEDQTEAIGDQVETVLEQELTGAMDGFSYSYRDADRYTAGNAEVETRNVNRLVIDWVAGSVTVEPWDGDTISVSETEVAEESHRLHWYQEGESLTIRFCASNAKGQVLSKDLTVLVPRDLANSLNKLQVNTVSADATVRGLEANRLELRGVSGALTAEGLYRELDVENVSGSVNLAGMVFDAEVETVSGSCVMDLEETPRELSFDGVSGSCTVYLPAGSRFEAEFETASGHLTNDFGPMREEAAELDFETVSGDVKILER